jgi:hypothetical protein
MNPPYYNLLIFIIVVESFVLAILIWLHGYYSGQRSKEGYERKEKSNDGVILTNNVA